jgi:chromosome partitioning protein
MILVCGGIKGGSGKSTVATNFAIMRSLAGREALLVDADDQESATDFTMLRNDSIGDSCGYTSIQLRDRSVLTELRKLKDKYDDIVIDTGGRDTQSQRAALAIADILMVPFVPRSLGVWTIEKVEQLVEDMRAVNPQLRALSFLNRADSIGSENQEACEFLSESKGVEYLDCSLGYRKAFGKAVAAGLAVGELKPQDRKASEEIRALYKCVYGV